jgi:Protein of unknown function (DUF3099)
MKTYASITELPPSPTDERRSRMIRYSLAMGLRMVCVVACFFVQGWWLLLPALGAVILPYIAVVAANAAQSSGGRSVERPGSIVPVRVTVRVPPDGDSA